MQRGIPIRSHGSEHAHADSPDCDSRLCIIFEYCSSRNQKMYLLAWQVQYCTYATGTVLELLVAMV
jgi:hypothetical protein